MHYVTPIRRVPRWLKIAKDILCCRFYCRHGETEPGDDTKGPELEAGATVHKADANDFHSDSALLKEIRVLSEKLKSDEKETTMAEEWKEIANILGRLFFYIFNAFQVIMAIVCFGPMPTGQPKPDSNVA